MEPKTPTETLIGAMEHLEGATHAIAIVAYKDGSIFLIDGGMQQWMLEGLVNAALIGCVPTEEVED